MNETRYQINWHFKDDVFSHCTVAPIRIVRRGILPGCTAESITAIDCDGRRFQGSSENYFVTAMDAWTKIRSDIVKSIVAQEKQLDVTLKQITALRKFLYHITPKPEDAT